MCCLQDYRFSKFHVDRSPSVGHNKDQQWVLTSLTTYIQGQATNAKMLPVAFSHMIIYMYS